MAIDLKAPFPWFGGKSRVASIVWPRFGDCPNYVEPFFGSGAMLLSRPHWNPEEGQWKTNERLRVECVCDLDGMVANFWRAVQRDPEQTAAWADNPVFELDLHARHQWLHGRLLSTEGLSDALIARARDRGILPFCAWMEASPDNYDCKVAGWWAWGLSSWIGTGFCCPQALGDAGRGVHRQLPQLRKAGEGVNRHLADVSGPSGACAHHRAALIEWFAALADRFRHVDVCCGDWERICGFSPTEKRAAPCAVFLDPPYSQEHGLDTVYGEFHDPGVAARVRQWCIERGQSKDLRICIAGYDTEHGELERHGWDVVAWKAAGGYGNLGKGSRGQENCKRERLWFSPGCVKPGVGARLF